MTTHVYFYHAQCLRHDNRVDMFSGVYRTEQPVVDDDSYARCSQSVRKAVMEPHRHQAFVLVNLSHIATVG